MSETTNFNNRLQPTSISLGTLSTFGYSYGTTNNSGNVLSQAISAPGFGVTQSYAYDALNRLTSVNESGLWSQSYGYDQYGNRTSVTSPTYMPTYAPAPTVNASTNRISDVNFAYDATGNLTQASPTPGAAAQTFAYDAENKLVNFNGGAAYSYDGEGRRVKKIVGTTSSIFVYNVPGQLVAEYTTPAPVATGGTSYLTVDHLGSTRVVTNASGTVSARHDYLPFGEEIPSGIGGRSTNIGYAVDEGIKQRFTAKERDSESSLDYFGARYFSGAQGRWASPDRMNVADDRLLAPSSTLNKYVYAANNPLQFTDPDGRDVVALLEPPHGGRPGHFAMLAYNQATEDFAFMSFGPIDRSLSGQILTAIGGTMGSTASFALPQNADEFRRDYAALSIQTTPEQAQDVINFFKQFSTTDNPYRLFQTNCTTVCRDALKAIGILPRNYGSITPYGLWTDLYRRFSNSAVQRFSTTNTRYGEQFQTLRIDFRQGVDYGSPRFGMNTFDFLMLMLRRQQPKACVEVSDSATGHKSKQCEQ